MTLEYHNAQPLNSQGINHSSSNQYQPSVIPMAARPVAHKRLILCCDGTWNEPSNSPGLLQPTNVSKMAQAIPAVDRNGIAQIVRYGRGVGTGDGVNRIVGGALGAGIDQDIQDAYLFLSMNYQPGDEIYLFGFSRGAYTVRSLAGFIYAAGLLKPQEVHSAAGVAEIDRIQLANRFEEAYQIYRSKGIKPSSPQAKDFRQPKQSNFGQVPIQLLCCWDTVGSLGIPDLIPGVPLNDAFNQRYRFHDHKLCSKIKYALHAVGLDEKRPSFNVTPMEVPAYQDSHLEQLLFPGDHGCIGGGTEATRKLANGPLQWVVDRIQEIDALQLEIDVSLMGEEIGDDEKVVTQPLDPIVNPEPLRMKFLWTSLGLFSPGFKRQILSLSPEAIAWIAHYTDHSEEQLLRLQQQRLLELKEAESTVGNGKEAAYDLHDSAKARLLATQLTYEPEPLKSYVEEVLGLKSDRLFQALQEKAAVAA